MYLRLLRTGCGGKYLNLREKTNRRMEKTTS